MDCTWPRDADNFFRYILFLFIHKLLVAYHFFSRTDSSNCTKTYPNRYQGFYAYFYASPPDIAPLNLKQSVQICTWNGKKYVCPHRVCIFMQIAPVGTETAFCCTPLTERACVYCLIYHLCCSYTCGVQSVWGRRLDSCQTRQHV